MSIVQIIKKLFNPETSIQDNKYYNIRLNSIFKEDTVHERFLRKGWFHFENMIGQEELDSLTNLYTELKEKEYFVEKDEFINTGCFSNEQLKQKTTVLLNQVMPSIFSQIFKMDKIESRTGGAYVIKPPHGNSSLGLHQDSSFIDEENDYSVMVWIPLVNVKSNEGALSVISGSHLWGSTQRSLAIDWELDKYKKNMKKLLEPIYVDTGDIVVFDSALIHASEANLSNHPRPAVLVGVVKKDAQLIFFYPSEKEDEVDKYFVDAQFFLDYDFYDIQRPSSSYKKETIKKKEFNYTQSEMVKIMKKYNNL